MSNAKKFIHRAQYAIMNFHLILINKKTFSKLLTHH